MSGIEHLQELYTIFDFFSRRIAASFNQPHQTPNPFSHDRSFHLKWSFYLSFPPLFSGQREDDKKNNDRSGKAFAY
jgi:hypothetical protein